jgi:hypothetical protein
LPPSPPEGAGGSALTDAERLLLYYAAMGLLPAEPLCTTRKYLETGRVLSAKLKEPEILDYMFLAAVARGSIATEALMAKYQEVLNRMGYDTSSILDVMSGGRYSAVLAANESLESEVKSLEGENKSLRTEVAELKAAAVWSMHKSGKSPEEISAELKFDLYEVFRILGNGGG